MAMEIEVKAHVDDPRTIKNGIFLSASPLISFEKNDCYWVPADKLPGGISKSGVRVRREKRRLPGNKEEDKEKILVTYKSKEVRDRIEINDELEFTVSDAHAFEELLKRLGLKPGLRKHKKGWSWIFPENSVAGNGNIHVELCEVTSLDRNLGWFAELEILTDDAGPETVTAARKRLLEVLDKLNIPRENIEERYYSELLS
ncbi:MAG: class IV adenylate cyclase [Treponema sp.]|jgi:adenylate cyclase class 2|nr:class IV adenylate cyclase [Treponema sp.]